MEKENKDSVYNSLLGMNKKQVVETLGEGFNYYPDDLWIYGFMKSRRHGGERKLFSY